ncbi:glycoside hydrolase family 16 protein [Athelia psychrophila]|uniref:Glycoside hydrolase family 16 protein n=1 Tax=Athelia psychrophila TaxID=1759441 RepID=A0A166U526_9AGAM|nr:glycoside hydrolase family 16 protein [Fibularhizoctonia sp. CBS 109695]
MYCAGLPLSLVLMVLLPVGTAALPGLSDGTFDWRSSLPSLWGKRSAEKRSSTGAYESEANGTEFLWITQDVYEGPSFFDRWTFFDQGDPTHGAVNFTDEQTAFANGLVYVTAENVVVMKGDNTTWLPAGAVRESVRISSITQYNGGLFILDLNRAPWGCGVWPAFWTCGPNWPYGGEIDVLEGVHDNEHNQVTWHTGPGCSLTAGDNFTGTVVGELDCDGTISGNPGCGITEWSSASYGPYFDSQGGGVFAMKWDDEGIAVWNFYRAAIPQDITDGQSPNPSGWGQPAAQLAPSGCNPLTMFSNHSIIFDITFCGDWAGNSYSTSGCPGTCAERVQDPSNFVNASWEINSLKVYKKQWVAGKVSGAEGVLDIRTMTLLLSGMLVGLIGVW